MAGTATAVGVIAVAATLTLGLGVAAAATATSVRASAAADAAALAAADTASGLVAGVPCERAADLAERSGGDLLSCRVDGLIATVEVRLPFGALGARARARAGPPPSAP